MMMNADEIITDWLHRKKMIDWLKCVCSYELEHSGEYGLGLVKKAMTDDIWMSLLKKLDSCPESEEPDVYREYIGEAARRGYDVEEAGNGTTEITVRIHGYGFHLKKSGDGILMWHSSFDLKKERGDDDILVKRKVTAECLYDTFEFFVDEVIPRIESYVRESLFLARKEILAGDIFKQFIQTQVCDRLTEMGAKSYLTEDMTGAPIVNINHSGQYWFYCHINIDNYKTFLSLVPQVMVHPEQLKNLCPDAKVINDYEGFLENMWKEKQKHE